MKKLRIDILSILIAALLAAGVIVFAGKSIGINTSHARSNWLTMIVLGALALSILISFEKLGRWTDAMRALKNWLRITHPDMTHTTQGSLMPPTNTGQWLQAAATLRIHLHHRYGWRWRYRLPWLLLTGDDAVIARLLPALSETGWLITPDAVLLYSRSGARGEPERGWLTQLYRLRRHRPIEAVITVLDGNATPDALRPGAHRHSLNLARIADTLRWSAPVYLLDIAQTDPVRDGRTPPIGCEFNPFDTRAAQPAVLEAALLNLRDRLARRCIAQIGRNRHDRYEGELSQRLDMRSVWLAQWITTLSAWRHRHQPISGAFFAPFAHALTAGPSSSAAAMIAPTSGWDAAPVDSGSASLPLWQHLGTIARQQPGQRTSQHPETILMTVMLTVVSLWCIGMLVSGVSNARAIRQTQHTLDRLDTARGMPALLDALLGLQRDIARYETRVAHPGAWSTCFRLNHDADVLAILWPRYARVSHTLLIEPVQRQLEAELMRVGRLPSDQYGQYSQYSQYSAAARQRAADGRAALTAYLMLAEPAHADATTLTPLLVRYWNKNWNKNASTHISQQTSIVTTAEPPQTISIWAQPLLKFYAQHLPANPAWHIQPQRELVRAARHTLLSLFGARRSADALYPQLLARVGNAYPDQTLATLTVGTDARGLIRSQASVPGVFTRQAYEGIVAPALEALAQENAPAGSADDWVLTGTSAPTASAVTGTGAGTPDMDRASVNTSDDVLPNALRNQLMRRYFAEYAQHWQSFMNSLQWERAPTLPAAIEQLKLLADTQQSPLLALLKSLQYQGSAGALRYSFADTLLAQAQQILHRAPVSDTVRAAASSAEDGPLAATFGPVLQLLAPDKETGTAVMTSTISSDVSLTRYLERLTLLRLTLQRIDNSSDVDARAQRAAQALFQGQTSPLADAQAYVQLVAASLGAQWAGMGETLFVQPVAQAVQAVLRPAQASLNTAWQRNIVSAWNASFAGRYPFADTQNDASLPELARFCESQLGIIPAFLNAQLAGVLEKIGDRWQPVAANNSLVFDPAFLKAINTLQRVAASLLVRGEPQYRFALKAQPTPGIVESRLMLDGQLLHYYNQRASWQSMFWPASDPQQQGVRLEWQTEQAGTNKSNDYSGRWGWIRMLEQARVEPLDSATYRLTWRSVVDTDKDRDVERSTGQGAARADNRQAYEAAVTTLNAHGPLQAPPPGIVYPLQYLMRTEAGRGPLALLALRDFALPRRIFIINAPDRLASALPPLPSYLSRNH
jgi:type VI secretion system protein ImpL